MDKVFVNVCFKVAILDAQTLSLEQHVRFEDADEKKIMRITVEKGGTSVLADEFVSHPCPTARSMLFSFAFGFALQIVDDIQDMVTDANDGQQTIMTLASDPRKPIRRLCHFLELILCGDSVIEHGMRQMCYTMVLKQVARVADSFDAEFLTQCESFCPIPMYNMKKLAGMKTLLKMVRENKL
jgi:hypothetical protein